jgi:hypothetical protein
MSPGNQGVFLASERGDFPSVMSLVNSFFLWQFCSPLFSFLVVTTISTKATDNLRRSNFQALIAANREVAFPFSQRSLCEI